MIAHALSIVRNELDLHLGSYGVVGSQVELGNVGELAAAGGNNGLARGKTVLSVVNVLEGADAQERAEPDPGRRRTPRAVRQRTGLPESRDAGDGDPQHVFRRPRGAVPGGAVLPVPQRLHQRLRDPSSLTTNAPVNVLDRLDEFKLIVNLMSPTLEEVNHLWGTLGGKQYPFALYSVRMLEMQFQASQGEGGLITEVIGSFGQTAAR